MAKNDGYIHPDFKLNGKSYSPSELRIFAATLIKESQSFEKNIGEFLVEWFDDSAEIEIKTSGSTGTPKIIKLQKEHMVNSAKATGIFFNLPSKTTVLICLPAKYIAGKMMLVRAIILGWELDCVDPNSNPLSDVSKNYDFSAMVPLQLENSLSKIDQIKTIIIGGAPMSTSLIEKVLPKSTQVFETYGMTETITHVAVKAIKSKKEACFKALPNVNFSVDERDCLVINAPQIATESIITNDIVNLISNSEFVWLGRFDSVINSGGVKLIPEQIEKKLRTVINTPFFVAGVEDEHLGQKLVLVIEGTINNKELKKKIDSLASLSKYENPKEIYLLNKFSYTETGKINRSKTLELL